MIETLINELKSFARKDFPVPEVSNYLQNLVINDNSLKQYTFLSKKFYTRNLIHREKDFEILLICWPPNTDSPIHGHEGEKWWARVEKGNLQICNYREVSKDPLKLRLLKKVSCDPGFLDGPADIHRQQPYQKTGELIRFRLSVITMSYETLFDMPNS